jgi:hypothetical protein
MLRKIMIVLAAGAALTAGLSDDAVARATAHSGWDGLGDGGGHPISSQKTPKPGATPRDPRVRKEGVSERPARTQIPLTFRRLKLLLL